MTRLTFFCSQTEHDYRRPQREHFIYRFNPSLADREPIKILEVQDDL